MANITEVGIPTDSFLHKTLASASFFDAYQGALSNTALWPADIFLRAASTTPAWIERAMAFRNALVRRIGLRDVGSMRDSADRPGPAYQPGDRMGIFNVVATNERELVLGIDDSHLDVRVSVMKDQAVKAATYTVSTVVHVKNALGRLYMLPVSRIHPWVVRGMMRRAHV